jgi:hypothetical protein
MMENVSLRNFCYDMREREKKLLQRVYHLHVFYVRARQPHNTASFGLQKASPSYDCSDICAIFVEKVLV